MIPHSKKFLSVSPKENFKENSTYSSVVKFGKPILILSITNLNASSPYTMIFYELAQCFLFGNSIAKYDENVSF